jgi:hypothetical protein
LLQLPLTLPVAASAASALAASALADREDYPVAIAKGAGAHRDHASSLGNAPENFDQFAGTHSRFNWQEPDDERRRAALTLIRPAARSG